jgi:gas vesicle protein
MFGRRQARTHSQLMREQLNQGVGHLWQAAAHAAGGVGATVGPKWQSAKGHVPPGIGKVRDVTAHGVDTTMAAFLPLLDAARSGAATATRNGRGGGVMSRKAQQAGSKAGKRESGMSRKRATMLVSLLAAGAAIGAAGAVLARRRHRAHWEEYEAQGIDRVPDSAKSSLDSAKSTMDRGGHRVASAAERTGGTVASWADAARDRVDSATNSVKETGNIFAEQAGHAANSAAGRAGEIVDHGKPKADQFADKAATISKNSRG